MCRDVVLILYGDRPVNDDDDDGAGCGRLDTRRLTPDEPAADLALLLQPTISTHVYY